MNHYSIGLNEPMLAWFFVLQYRIVCIAIVFLVAFLLLQFVHGEKDEQ